MTHDPQTSEPTSAATVTVFVSDPTAEAERVSEALRAAGFQVIDVPLSMLVARVALQRPHVVIVDADADGAIEAVARLREVPECESIDLLFTGRAGTLPSNLEGEGGAAEEGSPANGAAEALAFEGSGFFVRPVDANSIVKKVRALALGGGRSSAPPKRSPPPPSVSNRPPDSQGPQSNAPRRNSQPPTLGLSGPPGAAIRATPLSEQLEKLLAEAEGRVAAQHLAHEAAFSTPEEEIQAVLPEEILAALDAPLEDEDDEDDVLEPAPRGDTSGGRAETTGSQRRNETTGSQRRSETTGSQRRSELTNGDSSAAPTTGADRAPRSQRYDDRAPSTTAGSQFPRSLATGEERQVAAFGVVEPPRRPSAPPSTGHRAPPSVLSTTLGSDLLMQQGAMLQAPPPAFGDRGAASPPAASSGAQSAKAETGPPPFPPVVLGPTEPARVLAQAISTRATGTLTFESETGVRRIVVREGDLVTAASGIDSESLLAFLGARGDLPRERVAQLAGRLPPNGRHAGAALVAQGALGQDQLWPALRAHAEWLIGRCFSITAGTAHMEPEAPGRLRNEPSVFGGSTGAEVFVDAVRRGVDNPGALRSLGGSSRVAEGPQLGLLNECALGQAETELLSRSRGESVTALAASTPALDVAPLLYALSLLGVVEIVRAAVARNASVPAPALDLSSLDEEAVRDRVRARLELVDEGDYFAVLGVPRSATSYEVRRAYLDLRHAFDPTHLLTPRLADLSDDVRKIAAVLEEAYEILHDGARRERYRRAIEDVPALR